MSAVKFVVAGPAPARVVAKPVEVKIAVIPWKDGSFRVIAVDENGERLPHGNLLKVFPNGNVYPYHTINPALGMDLDGQGRLKVVYTNPDRTKYDPLAR